MHARLRCNADVVSSLSHSLSGPCCGRIWDRGGCAHEGGGCRLIIAVVSRTKPNEVFSADEGVKARRAGVHGGPRSAELSICFSLPLVGISIVAGGGHAVAGIIAVESIGGAREEHKEKNKTRWEGNQY